MLVTHCAMWLPLAASWKGRRNAASIGSPPASASVESKAAIHSWTCPPPSLHRSPKPRVLDQPSQKMFEPRSTYSVGSHFAQLSPGRSAASRCRGAPEPSEGTIQSSASSASPFAVLLAERLKLTHRPSGEKAG